jgi:hypothetical protein
VLIVATNGINKGVFRIGSHRPFPHIVISLGGRWNSSAGFFVVVSRSDRLTALIVLQLCQHFSFSFL